MKFAPRTRGEARLAIKAAMAKPRVLATADQIADLADALAAFKDKDYGAALALATAALESGPQNLVAETNIAPPARAPDERDGDHCEQNQFALGAPCPAHVPGCEIYATARLLMLQHGPWACTNAATRTDAFFAAGDRQSAAVWLRIFNAIGVLADGKRCRLADLS
jgi:hypothetical protein